MPEKNRKGALLGTFGFVGFLEKVTMKGGPLGLSLPLPDFVLDGFMIVSKKWTDQCEDCSLKRKGHLKVERAD